MVCIRLAKPSVARATGGERLAQIASGKKHLRAFLQAALGQQYIRRDHHGAGARILRNPVVRGVETVAYHHALYALAHRNAEDVVADHAHMRAMALGHAIDFVFHRTGVGIDQNGCRHITGIVGAGSIGGLGRGHRCRLSTACRPRIIRPLQGVPQPQLFFIFSRPLIAPGFCDGWDALVLIFSFFGLRASRLFFAWPLAMIVSSRGGMPRTHPTLFPAIACINSADAGKPAPPRSGPANARTV